ncbi:hypothetical protein HF086_005663 [Spodoptera exigua]|uniref:Uncharacterized protein n=1 Tax=Spodoptera exigua TaxID=7107 RepID=A0A922MY63_SPOEX|nr:hypothetical protein HF086_005663 [Spodoptera exigua]
MKAELPVCTRCCFCLPLRRGLLVWGYIKLKKVKYMRLFYFLSIGILAVTGLLLIAQTCLMGHPSFKFKADLLEYYIKIYTSYFIVIVVQAYFILLLRSEIIKLKNSCKFRFVNNAAEALCSLECEVPAPAAPEPAEGDQ